MRALLPEPSDSVDLHAFYAAGWVERGGLRMDFVASADGAAQAAGRSAGLQTPGDNRVFAVQRDLADVVLIGAGTAIIEGYSPVVVPPHRLEARRRFGLADVPPVAVVSRSLRLDPAAPLFAGAPATARTIVLTCDAAPPAARAALAQVADVAICGDDLVDPARARAALEERGHSRILCEGGPTLFGEFARAGVADELCLSITPLLVGPGALRIVAGPPGFPPATLTLLGLLEEDGALFARYRIGR